MNKDTIRLIIEVLILPIITFAVVVLSDLNKSVSLLNTQVGILLNSSQNLEKRVDKLESAVFKLNEQR
jgi:chaperonin cofactor prefoldin